MKLTCYITFFVSLFSLFSCKSKEAKFILNNQQKDSIELLNYNFLKDISENDSTAIVDRSIDFTLKTFEKYSTGKPLSIDTLSGKDNFVAKIHFISGNLFDKNAIHGVAEFNLETQRYYIICQKKEEKWSFNYKIDGLNLNTDSLFHIRDVNFDGYNDFLGTWFYTSGRCNCRIGCFNLYLYDSQSQCFVPNDAFEHYLDVAILDKEKSVIVGNHCGSYYNICKWKNNALIPYEKIVFSLKEGDNHWYQEKPCIRKKYHIKNGSKILVETKKTCELPQKWEAAFMYDLKFYNPTEF